MATTTKKSTKAKTKTSATKKTTAPSKTAAAKTVSKTVKVTKTAAATPKRSAKQVTMETLRKWNIASVVVFAILAVVAGFVMGNTSYQLTMGHLAKDELASKSGTVLAPAVQAVYDMEIRWAVVGIMLLAAVVPLLYVTKLQKMYSQYVRSTRMMPLRWINMGVTWALVTEVVALMSGVHDIGTLKLMGGMVLVSALLGLVAERQNNATDKPVRSAYYTGLFAGVLPWVVIAAYAITTVVSGATSSPWYLYAIYGTSVVTFVLAAINQHKAYARKGRWADYVVVERNYLAIDMVAKVAFAALLIVGLQSL